MPRSIVIGFIDVPSPIVFRTSYETAAWHTDAVVPAGRYLLEESTEGHRTWFSARFPGVIVSEYMPALWGGVPIGRSAQGVDHPNVGKPHVSSLYWYDDFYLGYLAKEVAETGHYTIVDAISRKSVRCPVTLIAGEAILDHRLWSVHMDFHRGATGFRGKWIEYFGVRTPLLLPARVPTVPPLESLSRMELERADADVSSYYADR